MRTLKNMFLAKLGDFENFDFFTSIPPIDEKFCPNQKSRKFSILYNFAKNMFLGVLIDEKHDFYA